MKPGFESQLIGHCYIAPWCSFTKNCIVVRPTKPQKMVVSLELKVKYYLWYITYGILLTVYYLRYITYGILLTVYYLRYITYGILLTVYYLRYIVD